MGIVGKLRKSEILDAEFLKATNKRARIEKRKRLPALSIGIKTKR